jgi:predicted MPP superfamily phosphohydrolase
MVTVYGGSHFYFYRRACRILGFEPGTWQRKLLRYVVFGLALSFPMAIGLARLEINWATRGLYCVAATWMGLYFYLLFLTLLMHLVHGILRRTGAIERLRRLIRMDPDRAGLALAAVVAVSLCGYGMYRAAGPIGVTKLELTLPGLPAELDGTTVVQLSDVHIGVVIGSQRLERVADRVADLEPDLIVITGDLIDEDVDHVAITLRALRRLRAPLGVYASTGNHEFFAGVDEATYQFAQGGIRTLRNEAVALADGKLLLVGIDDPTGARFGGVEVRYQDVLTPEARGLPCIVLFHQPRHFDEFAELGADLILAGHTHGGQFQPIGLIQRLIYPWPPGLSRVGKGYAYVSRGVGTWGPPLRVGAPPEIVHITLRHPGHTL